MDNILLLFVCLLSGLVVQKIPSVPKTAYEGINLFLIYVSLPAVTLLYIPQIQWNLTTALLLSVSGCVFLFAWLFFKGVAHFLKWNGKTFACLVLTCGLGNTSFVGFPLVELLYGQEGLKLAVLVDQGSFLALATVGIGTALQFAEGKVRMRTIVRKIVFFPPFIAFVCALIFQFWEYPLPVVSVLKKLSSTLVPLALFSVGFQLKLNLQSDLFRDLSIGLVYKLFFAPLVIFIIFYGVIGKNDLNAQISVIEAAMPPMVTASILASSYQLRAELAQLITGLGILTGFATVVLWYWFLGGNA